MKKKFDFFFEQEDFDTFQPKKEKILKKNKFSTFDTSEAEKNKQMKKYDNYKKYTRDI